MHIKSVSQKVLTHPVSKVASRLHAGFVRKVLSSLVLATMLATLLPPASFGDGPLQGPQPQEPGRISMVRGEDWATDASRRGLMPGPFDLAAAQAAGWEEVTVTQVAPPESMVQLVPNELAAQEKGPASEAQSDDALSALASASYFLVATPEYLNFFGVQGGSNPASQTLRLRNKSGGTLNYSIQEDIPWLSLSPASGSLTTEMDTVTVWVNAAGLKASDGPFVGTITISDLGDPSNTRLVTVRLGLDTVDRRTDLYSYDSNGNLQRRIDANGAIVDYEYDSLNRLTRISYPGGTSVSYTYDANGNRASMTDAWGTTNYVYDDYNRLTAVYYPGLNPVVYEYDQADNLTRITYPDGRTVSYGYDADNRLTTVSDSSGTTTYSYDPTTGNLASKSLPNGVTTTYGYDSDGRLTDVTNRGPGSVLISSYHYTLDANGMRTSVRETTPAGTKTTSYTYDDLYRLASVTYPDGRTVSYEYDEAGNRLKMTTPEGTTAYTYDTDNRLLRAGDEEFFYDRNGNLIQRVSSERTIEYSYDSENRLIRYDDGETVVQFVYDGDGNRIAKIVDGVRVNYVNDVNGLLTQVLIEADGDWQVDKTYTLGLDRISQQEVTADPSFYLYDSPGRSVTGLAGDSGALVNTYQYDAFGETIAQTGNIGNVYTYNGEQNDPETSLIYLRNRYYDPAWGRFFTRDAFPGFLVVPETQNPYVYTANNPVNYVDPTGALLDLALDVGFIGYDLVQLAKNPRSKENWIALGADVGLAIVPFATGGGIAVRAASKGNQYIRQSQILGKSGEYFVANRLGLGAFQQVKVGDRIADILKGSIIEVKNAAKIDPRSVNQIMDFMRSGYKVELATRVGTNMPSGLIPFIESGALKVSQAFTKSGASRWWSYGRSYLGSGVGALWANLMNQCGDPGDVGGVSLSKTADLLLNIEDIAGATYDEKTGQIVFFGKEDVTLPEMDMDDLAVAVHSVFGGEDPGVSIDPPIVGGQFSVRYEGTTRETEFGWVMFESDRVLKILSLGRDNITGQLVTSSVPGYQSLLDRYLASGECNPGETSIRFWFRPKEVRLVRSDSGRSMVFDAVSMEVLTESKFQGGVVGDPEAEAFAAHFTEHYDEFAEEYPILKDLERLGKIVAVVKWIKDNDIPLDVSFLDNYQIEFYSTPDQTPSITVQGDNGTCIITLEGGVTYRPPNEYLADDPVDPVTEAMSEAALGQRPSETQFMWDFTPPPEAGSLGSLAAENFTAVAESLARSRKDGNFVLPQTDMSFPITGDFALNLTRYYDSFWDKPTGFSFGWVEVPFALRFPLYRQTFTFGGGLTLDLYEKISVLERPQGREDVYTLLGIDGSNRPLYQRSGSVDLLRENADGTFTLFKKDESQIRFNASGQIIAFVDNNGNQVNYSYTGGRLTRISSSGRQINLSYDGQGRIVQAAGPGGRTVTYAYNADGNLASVTNQASGQTITYSYDADRHLVRAVDNKGNIVFDHSYDVYGRAPDQTFGQDAPFDFDYDLESRSTVVTDPFSNQTHLAFDAKYRLLGRTNALGYAISLAYAGDLGPSTFTDVHGATTHYEYDIHGNVTAIIDDQGGRTDLYYDGYDNLIAMEDPKGVQTAFEYDAKSNLTKIYHEVTLVFDAGGNLVSFYYDPNNVTTFAYDSRGNLLSVTDPEGNISHFNYDSFGMVAAVEEASGLDTTYTYDGLSRLQRIRRGSSNVTFGYNNADNLTSISTSAGSVGYGYDGNNNLEDITDAEGNHTHFDYDQDNNLTNVVDAASKATQYAYDVLGNLTEVKLPNDTVVSYEYDELGRLVRVSSGEVPSPPRDNDVYLPIILRSYR